MMSVANHQARRAAAWWLAAPALAGAMFVAAPSASAIPPNCTAGDLASVSAGVSTATAAYLFSHPDVNNYLTSLRDDSDEQAAVDLQQYLDANPQVKAELGAIRQPLEDLRMRCGTDSDPMPTS